jgi:exopolysaccharide production protein ExoZ
MISTLQAGRAIAAISVAAFHMTIMMAAPRYGGVEVFREVTRYGARGVDFFFVLSGFIILFAHARDIGHPAAWRHYVARRFVRVYPIYWLYTLAFVVALAILGGTDAEMPSKLPDWTTALTLVRFTAATPPLGQGWTLFHEVAFYALFSLLILRRSLGVAALTAFVLVAVLFHQYPPDLTRTPFNVYTADYNIYFVLGMGAWWLYRQGGKGVMETLGGIAISATALFSPLVPEGLSLLGLAAGLALLLAGVVKLELAGLLRIPRWLAAIGDASYSIYLTHINVEGVVLKVALKLHLNERIGPQLTYFVALAATVGIGWLAYLFVERPLLRFLKRRRDATPARPQRGLPGPLGGAPAVQPIRRPGPGPR